MYILKKCSTFAAENVGKSDKIPSKYIGKTDKRRQNMLEKRTE